MSSDLTPYAASKVAAAVLEKEGVKDVLGETTPRALYENPDIDRYRAHRRILLKRASFEAWLEQFVNERK